MAAILTVSNVRKQYDRFTLEIPHFSLNEGEIRAFVGKNGAGKTTFLKAILNQVALDAGTITIFNEEVDSIVAKELAGFSFNDVPIFHPNFTAKEADRVMKGIYHSWKTEIFTNLLARFTIDPVKMYSELSTGMKVKFNLALAVSHEPKLLILDEVTSGLDPVSRKDILVFLKEIQQTYQTAILFSTHIVEDLADIADSLTVIKEGKIVLEDQMAEISSKYYIKDPQFATDNYLLKLGNESSSDYLYKLADEEAAAHSEIKDIIDFCLG
ncbi:ABC transporter ATP-binding protein [Enterococcus hirae]|nr:ABC transporter ATP-binding protein [Enterococcus hirae]